MLGNAPISIRVNGKEHVDFKDAVFTCSMESFARSFHFVFSDKWLRTGLQDLPFVEGDPCEIYIHGHKVLDGFIEDLPIDYDATSHKIEITGFSWTKHLVDCSAVHKTGSWKNVKIQDLAKDLCEPYGIGVKVDPWALPDTLEPFNKWAIEDEETVFDCIQRAAKMRGLFLLSDEHRNVIITKASEIPVVTPLVLGQNVKRARRVGRWADRHSEYFVKSQRAGSDAFYADQVSGPFFRVQDPQVRSFRPLVIVSDGQGTKPELETRAQWEMRVRAGRSRRITYNHQGFRAAVGNQVWPINRLVTVVDPYLDANGPLLIVSAHFHLGAQGETVDLDIGRPEAFDVRKPVPKAKKGKSWALW